jgi:hypothetical protein
MTFNHHKGSKPYDGFVVERLFLPTCQQNTSGTTFATSSNIEL